MASAALKMEMEIGSVFNPSEDICTFSPVPNWLMCRPEISFGAKCLYARLRQYAGKNNEVFPKICTLAKELGTSERSVGRYIRELEKISLIQSVRRGQGRSNTYSFLSHIWQYQRQSDTSRYDRAVNSGSDKLSVLYKEEKNTSKEKLTAGGAGAAVVSPGNDDELPKKNNPTATVMSLPDEQQTKTMLDLIPSDIPVTEGIKRIVRAHLAKSGEELVKRNIAYVNAVKLRDRSAYRAYLDKALREDYGIDHAEKQKMVQQAVRQSQEKATETEQQAKRELTEGLNAAQRREEIAKNADTLPDDEKKSLQKQYLETLKGRIRCREERRSLSDLFKKSIGFRLFLESSATA
jgi:hypothetical protein